MLHECACKSSSASPHLTRPTLKAVMKNAHMAEASAGAKLCRSHIDMPGACGDITVAFLGFLTVQTSS